MTERTSPLHNLHVSAGASFTDFAGWQMPVRYTSDLDEHHAVRQRAGIFDISHMAEIDVRGPDSPAYLDYALTGNMSKLDDGQAKYALIVNEDGGIIDDLIVYRRGRDHYLIVANAGNRNPVVSALRERIGSFRAVLTDLSDEIALIAVQGPASLAILTETTGLEVPDLSALKYFRFTTGLFHTAADETAHGDGQTAKPVEALIARTGYTGENGYELYIDNEQAAALWQALVAAGASHGLQLAGLAARDTLRLEAGMPLYGHELSLDITPAQARLERAVALDKPADFVGRVSFETAQHESEAGERSAPLRMLVGLTAEGRRAARAEYTLHPSDTADTVIGAVTSGVLSPTLGHPIALAYVDPEYAREGTTLSADIRGKRLTYTVTSIPFYRRAG